MKGRFGQEGLKDKKETGCESLVALFICVVFSSVFALFISSYSVDASESVNLSFCSYISPHTPFLPKELRIGAWRDEPIR